MWPEEATYTDSALQVCPARAGFEKPILHGLCTFGMICKAAVDEILDGDVTRVARYRARFAKPVQPGDRLRVRFWKEGTRILVDVTKQDGTPVLKQTWLELRS